MRKIFIIFNCNNSNCNTHIYSLSLFNIYIRNYNTRTRININIQQVKFKNKILYKFKWDYSFIFYRYISFNNKNLKNCKSNSLIVFNNYLFIKQFIKYLFIYLRYKKFKELYIILHYLSTFIESLIYVYVLKNNNLFKFSLTNKYKSKSLINIETNWINYFYNLWQYYQHPYNYKNLFKLSNFHYIITYIYFFLNKIGFINLTIIDPFYLKLLGLSGWAIFTSLFIRKKYKEYKYNFDFNLYSKYKYKYSLYNKFYSYFKIYYKYGGNYNRYIYLKKLLILNKNLNKKFLLIYDFKANQFLIKLNGYYNLLLEELKNDPTIIKQDKQDYIYGLFNLFLKNKLDTPFLDNDIPFTYFYFKNGLNKKKLEQLSFLVSYGYLQKKIKYSKISHLQEAELFINYKNFYKWSIKENFKKGILDVFGIEGFDPYSTPARIYKKFQKWIDFESLFNNIDLFDINTLYDYILKAFTYINETEIMFSVNVDEIQKNDHIKDFKNLKDAVENNEIDIFDYKLIKNDLNLCLFLNTKALNDSSFITFLNDLKSLSSNSNLKILNIDLFEESYLSDVDLLNLFLKEKLFYLDYFTISINLKKYSLCYLLFLFKVLKNKKNYEVYYDKYCEAKINKYNKIVYKYHAHVSNKLKKLTNVFNSFIKYKTNNDLIHLNNFDNINFVTKLKNKNFNNIYRKNYRNNIKIYNENDYNEFLLYFERYKSADNFVKKELKISECITFDDFYYSDINISNLLSSIELKKKKVEYLNSYYIYENNELLNFADLGFYLYDIEGFENYKEDIFLFFDYKEHKLLQFIVNDLFISDKIEFQKNYSMLYFHYILKLFKNFKQYTFNIIIEQLIFEDTSFIYPHYDNSMNEKRQDFLLHIECFIKALKTITRVKHEHILNFINYMILHYGKFSEYNELFDYNLIYDPLIIERISIEKIYKLEDGLDHIMQVWKHILERIEDARVFYAECINVLKLEKLVEFFDFPMFSELKGFLLLKEAYLISLEELIIEERAFDHALNISMCLFRTFDKHNNFFKREVLFKNGIMSKLCYLTLEDWNYIFELEKENPLIIIELYNSKQKKNHSELWNNNVTFIEMVYTLCNLSEKQVAYETGDADWKPFFEEMSNRDLIIYDLNEKDVLKLHSLFNIYNNTWFNPYNLEEVLVIFFQNNSLEYDAVYNIFRKIQKNNFIEDENSSEELASDIIIDKQNFKNEKKSGLQIFLSDKLIYVNKEYYKIYSFNMFNNTMDAVNDIVEMNKPFFNYLENKINVFPQTNFKMCLLNMFLTLKEGYDNLSNVLDINDFLNSLNYLFYLVKFYDNILLLINFNVASINIVNDNIINNNFNYLSVNNKFMDLTYLDLMFKSINKEDREKSWSTTLSQGFNNRFLFLYYNAQSYLLDIFDILDKKETFLKIDLLRNYTELESKDLFYLPNLNAYINKCNFNNDLIYNIYDCNFINTFDTLFNSLNMHILKANYMLTQLNTFKHILNDIYLNYYNIDKSNLHILKDLYFDLSKKNQNMTMDVNFKYLSLLNLLLYVKDPIYLYNILTFDLKIYIKNILSILDIIHKPENHNDTYKSLIEFLMYKHVTLTENWTEPLWYKGWSFNSNNSNSKFFKKLDKIDKINVSYFFSYGTIIDLNNAISNLDQYNGYFNLDNFNLELIKLNKHQIYFKQEFNLLDMFNINKLLYHFDSLFTVNNIKGLRFYSLNEFILYNENNLEELNNCYNYNMLLTFMLKQSYRYSFCFNQDTNQDINKQQKIDQKLIVKDFEDLIGLKNNNLKYIKRKSAPSILYNKKKKTKIIKKIINKGYLELEEFNWDNENQEDADDVNYKYGKVEILEVTDSESEEKDKKEELELQKSKNKQVIKKVNKNIFEIKQKVMSDIYKNFIQWASDLDFCKAYFDCKEHFDTVLFDLQHPVWDEHRLYFSSDIVFKNYINRLNEEEKESIFNIYWDWTIQEVLKKREKERKKRIKKNWLSRLFYANQQKEYVEYFRSDEFLDIFCTNLESNEKWKKQWHNDLFFFEMDRGTTGKEARWRTLQYCKERYDKETDVIQKQRGAIEKNIFRKDETQLELWDKTNWWKKW